MVEINKGPVANPSIHESTQKVNGMNKITGQSLATEKKTPLSTVPQVDLPSEQQSISRLNKELEQSIKLETAMIELQNEFRKKGENISQNVNKLGQLLGIARVA